LALLGSLVTAQKDKCNAMVISGGANNGAWEAGIMWGFVNYGNLEDFMWNVYSGVSAGSLNTMLLAAGKAEDLK
jgi:predicted acylesterase/phospholipase RssA